MIWNRRHSNVSTDKTQYNGFFTNLEGIYVFSGTLDAVQGSQTGTISFSVDSSAAILYRVEAFHSGSASSFNMSLTSIDNTGSAYDPRKMIVSYDNIPGSSDFSSGLDQTENLIALTNTNEGSVGNIYFNLMPYGSGLNSFKYLVFFKKATIYTTI